MTHPTRHFSYNGKKWWIFHGKPDYPSKDRGLRIVPPWKRCSHNTARQLRLDWHGHFIVFLRRDKDWGTW